MQVTLKILESRRKMGFNYHIYFLCGVRIPRDEVSNVLKQVKSLIHLTKIKYIKIEDIEKCQDDHFLVPANFTYPEMTKYENAGKDRVCLLSVPSENEIKEFLGFLSDSGVNLRYGHYLVNQHLY